MMYMFPKEKKAFFISHNTDSETADYEVFNKILIEHLEIPPQANALPKEATNDVASWSGYYVPVITKVAPFGLLDYMFSFTKVNVKAYGAAFSPFQKEPMPLYYLGNHKFIAEGKISPSHVFYKDELGQMYISTGLTTIKKTNGLFILLAYTSFASGLAGVFFLLLSWLLKFIRFKKEVWKHPLVWHFLAVALILLAVSFLLYQPFVSLGDKTVGSVLLALGTILLPAFTAVSIYKYLRYGLLTLLLKADLVALIFVLQFTAVLSVNGLIPLLLWK
jgi:hypothetical protein